jgi:hypothetical protein
LAIMPVRSGYGPAVSSGVTAQLDVLEVPPVVVVPVEVAVLVGLVAEAAQPTANPTLAEPNAPRI